MMDEIKTIFGCKIIEHEGWPDTSCAFMMADPLWFKRPDQVVKITFSETQDPDDWSPRKTA